MGWGILHGALFSVAVGRRRSCSARCGSPARTSPGRSSSRSCVGDRRRLGPRPGPAQRRLRGDRRDRSPRRRPGVPPARRRRRRCGAPSSPSSGSSSAPAPGGVGGALGGFFGGAIVGALFGAFTAISFSLQVGVALGVTRRARRLAGPRRARAARLRLGGSQAALHAAGVDRRRDGDEGLRRGPAARQQGGRGGHDGMSATDRTRRPAGPGHAPPAARRRRAPPRGRRLGRRAGPPRGDAPGRPSTSRPRSGATPARRPRRSAGRPSSSVGGPRRALPARSSTGSSASPTRCRRASFPTRSRRPSGPSATTGRRSAGRSSASSPRFVDTNRQGRVAVRRAGSCSPAACPLASQVGREIIKRVFAGVGRRRREPARRRSAPGIERQGPSRPPARLAPRASGGMADAPALGAGAA